MSLRTRLTLVYGGLFLLMAIVLEAATYAVADHAMNLKFQISVNNPSDAAGDASTFRIVNDLPAQIARQKHAVLTQLVQSSLLTLAAVALLALAVGYLVSGRMLRPLRHITATARRLSGSTLHERIGLAGPHDEIKELADTFDGMLDRLHRAFDSQRRFIANASHELRTPLAINRTLIDVAVAKPGAPEAVRTLGGKLLGAITRHERLLDGLLLLARSEHELQERSPADLAAVARGAVEQLADAARRAGIAVTTVLQAAPTSGDLVLLERCAVNLVENAIKYNAPEARVWVRTGRFDGTVWLQVENTGPPVTDEQAESIFEPFRRLRRDRVGSARGAGLGLSIVRAVLTAHHGTARAEPRPGGGLAVTLRLPAVDPAPAGEPRRAAGTRAGA
jgi:signal transduction histidine kinase